MDTYRVRFGVEPICREIEASASAYRARRTRPPSARALRDEYLLGEIERVHAGSDRIYGQLKIWDELNDEGAAKRSGVELLGVVLGTPSEAARFRDARKLFDWGFPKCQLRQVVASGETHTAEQNGRRVMLYVSHSVSAVVLAGRGPVTKRVVMSGSDGGQAAVGGQVATLVVSQGNAVLARVPLLARRQTVGGIGGIFVGLALGAAVVFAVAVAAVLQRRGVRGPAGREATLDRRQGPGVVRKRAV